MKSIKIIRILCSGKKSCGAIAAYKEENEHKGNKDRKEWSESFVHRRLHAHQTGMEKN